jgi:hypothetical protein
MKELVKIIYNFLSTTAITNVAMKRLTEEFLALIRKIGINNLCKLLVSGFDRNSNQQEKVLNFEKGG